MTPRVKKLYKSAIKNKKFVSVMESADGDKKPTIFSSEQEKALYAIAYYGWMICEHGIAWELHL